MNNASINPVEISTVNQVYLNEMLELCRKGLSENITMTFSTIGHFQDFIDAYIGEKLYDKAAPDLITIKIETSDREINLGLIMLASAAVLMLGAAA